MSDNDLLNNYLSFINASNQSLHSMLEIMNNQQQTFNLLLQRYNSNLNYRERYSTTRFPNYYRTRNPNIFSTNYSINLENLLNEFNNDVIVRPTNQQILDSTTRCHYCDINNPINTSCPISHNEFTNNTEVIMINHCRHIFLPDQILHWFENNVRCPLCRYDIRENINNNEPELQLNEETRENIPDSNNINSRLSNNQQILRNSLLNSFSQFFNNSDPSMNVSIDFYYLDR